MTSEKSLFSSKSESHFSLYSPAKFRALAMLSLAAIEACKQDYASELDWLIESLKLSPSIEALRGIAIVKAKEGYHRTSLKELEVLIPLAKFSEPLHYCDFPNFYAVELAELGRKEEARNVVKQVLASPFAPAYPEWQETARKLKKTNRSFVAVGSVEPAPVEIETKETYPASEPTQSSPVLPFRLLKEAPRPQKPERLTPQEYAELAPNEKRELFLAAFRSGAVREDDYFKMMVMAGLLKNGPVDKILDLEDEEVLNDIAIMWSVQVGREEFVGFLSALRDCDDSVRQTNILDRLITKIFHETQLCGVTEEEWRLRVERRIPGK